MSVWQNVFEPDTAKCWDPDLAKCLGPGSGNVRGIRIQQQLSKSCTYNYIENCVIFLQLNILGFIILQEIQGKSFHKVGNVKRLILNHNDLYIVSAMHHPR